MFFLLCWWYFFRSFFSCHRDQCTAFKAELFLCLLRSWSHCEVHHCVSVYELLSISSFHLYSHLGCEYTIGLLFSFLFCSASITQQHLPNIEVSFHPLKTDVRSTRTVLVVLCCNKKDFCAAGGTEEKRTLNFCLFPVQFLFLNAVSCNIKCLKECWT